MVAFQLNFGVKEWDDAIAAIATQDDRSTAIVTTSLLEDMIVTAIKSHLCNGYITDFMAAAEPCKTIQICTSPSFANTDAFDSLISCRL